MSKYKIEFKIVDHIKMIKTSTHKKTNSIYFEIFKIPQTTRPIIIYISKF